MQLTQEQLDEIEMLREAFELLGMTDPVQVVSNWLDKHDENGHRITSVNEVLDYMRRQLQAMQRSSAETAEMTGEEEPAASTAEPEESWKAGARAGLPTPIEPGSPADQERIRREAVVNDHKARLALWATAVDVANTEWREAVRMRKEAMAQWDAYVESKRRVFQHTRNSKPSR